MRGTLTAWLVVISTFALPALAQAQHSGVEIWAASCGRCHKIQPPGRYTAKDWGAIMGHMTLAARLTDAQRDAVLDFLQRGAMKVASVPQGRAPVAAVQPDLGLVPATMLWQNGVLTTRELSAHLCASATAPLARETVLRQSPVVPAQCVSRNWRDPAR